MNDRITFYLSRLSERLWVRPLAMSLLSVVAVFGAKAADGSGLAEFVPQIVPDSIETLLGIMAASMLVIATLSVASMVAAYASAGSTATPRSFAVVIADDVSQNALSMFIGAFIFSIVALISLMNSYFDKGGRFALFALTLMVFAIVILTFVRWVDNIARLGRLGGNDRQGRGGDGCRPGAAAARPDARRRCGGRRLRMAGRLLAARSDTSSASTSPGCRRGRYGRGSASSWPRCPVRSVPLAARWRT